jgi:hypothetical protein
VLRAALSRNELLASREGAELGRRRSITLSPRLGAPAVLRERTAA